MRPRLTTLLVALNAGSIVLAVAGTALGAAHLLRRSVQSQAIQRVTAAAGAARALVALRANEAEAAARLLADRPTLRRLLAADPGGGGAVPFLERFREAGGLDGCAVLRGGAVVAAAGPTLPWASALAVPPTGIHASGDGGLLLVGRATLDPAARLEAVTAFRVDDAFAAGLAHETGVALALGEVAHLQSESSGRRAAALARALSTGRTEVTRLEESGVWLAALPLDAGLAGSDPVGAVLATLAGAETGATGGDLFRRLALIALLLGGLAAFLGFLVGRRIGGPIEEMTEAAARIGAGDLARPVPRFDGIETGRLSAALDDMRRHLLDLTADLRRREAEAAALLEGIAEGVFAVDGDRRIRYLNPQAAALLGVRAEDAAGRFCGDVLGPEAPGGVRPCESACPILLARSGGGFRAVESIRVADGAVRTVVITSAPPVADGGPEARQVQVLRDETEVEAGRRLRDAVLAQISHEFRTPLSAQLASIELLLDELDRLGPEEVRSLIRSLQRGSLRLTQLVDNLLESVRLEAGERGIRRRPVRLDEVVEEAVELTRPLLVQRGQSLAVEAPVPLPVVEGDAPRLVQVLVNLLANAGKFSPEGGAVRVGGEVAEREVRLFVEDEGPGLPEGPRPSPFRRRPAADGSEPESHGMGLGLWIAQSIVERHGGRLEAVRIAGGTRMVVALPRGGAA